MGKFSCLGAELRLPVGQVLSRNHGSLIDHGAFFHEDIELVCERMRRSGVDIVGSIICKRE